MKNNTSKLDQLTTLRFIAAFMIVIHHSTGLFGIRNIGFTFGQGVSFFFILSGFILTYVYPTLDTWLEIKRFLRARFARIWPAYCASLLLYFVLVRGTFDIKTFAANLFMLQGWIPLPKYYFSYNVVAWSVSTEFFFYLAFPFIIYKWNNTWLIKFLLSGAMVIALMVLSNTLSLPDYGRTWKTDGLSVTSHGLLYINPLSRIFEFVFGMCIALAWRKKANIEWPPLLATSFELGAILLCAISMYNTDLVMTWSKYSILEPALDVWLRDIAPMPFFGLLIYVMALGRGKISKLFSHPSLVFLGEISFSIYLIHRILLTYYSSRIASIQHLPNPVAFGVFMIILLLSSYLMWVCIEMPGRRLLLGSQKIHGTSIMQKSWSEHVVQRRKPLIAGFVLGGMIVVILLHYGIF